MTTGVVTKEIPETIYEHQIETNSMAQVSTESVPSDQRKREEKSRENLPRIKEVQTHFVRGRSVENLL